MSILVNIVLLLVFILEFVEACPEDVELYTEGVASQPGGLTLFENDGRYCGVYENISINIRTKTSFQCSFNKTGWPSFVASSNLVHSGLVEISCTDEISSNSGFNYVNKCSIDTNVTNSTVECWTHLLESIVANSTCLNNRCLNVSCSIRFDVQLLPHVTGNLIPSLSIHLMTVNSNHKQLNYMFKPVSIASQCLRKCQEPKLALSPIPANNKLTGMPYVNVKLLGTENFTNYQKIIKFSSVNASLHYLNVSCLIGSLSRIDDFSKSSVSFNVTAISNTNPHLDCNISFTYYLCEVLPTDVIVLSGEAILTASDNGSDFCDISSIILLRTTPATINISSLNTRNLAANTTFDMKVELYLHQCMSPLIVKVLLPNFNHQNNSINNTISQQSVLQWIPDQDILSTVESQGVIMNNSVLVQKSNQFIDINFGDVLRDGSDQMSQWLLFHLKFTVSPLSQRLSLSGDITVELDSTNISSSLPLATVLPDSGAELQLLKVVESVQYLPDKTSMTFKLTTKHLPSSRQAATNITISDMASNVLVENAWSLQAGHINHVQVAMRNDVTVTGTLNHLPIGDSFVLFYNVTFIAGSQMLAKFGLASVTWVDQQSTNAISGEAFSNKVCVTPKIQYTIQKEPSYGFIALGVFCGLFLGTVLTMVILYLMRKTKFMRKLHVDFELTADGIEADGRDTTFHLSDGYGLESSRESEGINNEILTKESFGYWTCFAASASPLDADVLITRDMVRDICDYQKCSSAILLQCWQSTIRHIISDLCRSGNISCENEIQASQSVDTICSEINHQIAATDKEAWHSVIDINNTCCQIVKSHSIIALRTQERGKSLLGSLIAASNVDGVAKELAIESYESSNKYMTKALDDYMEHMYEECQRMAWKRRSMALLLSFSHNRYFVLIDWLVKKFLMELDQLQRKRVLSHEMTNTISENVKETAGKASLRYHLAVKTHVINLADKTATQYMKQSKTMESKWSMTNTAALEKNTQHAKYKKNAEIEGAIDKRILACQEIEKELFKLKCNLDDKAFNNLKKYLAETRRTSIDWFTTLMMKVGSEIDSKTAQYVQVSSGAETSVDATQEVTDPLESSHDQTTICDVITETIRQVPEYDAVTNNEIEAAHCLIKDQLQEELKVLSYNYGNCSLLKEIRRKAKVIIRSVLGSCPCNGKPFVEDLFQRWSLSVTNRVLGRFLFKGLKELQWFECKLKTRKHTEIFTAILPTHSLQKLLETEKHSLQGLIRYLITRIDKVYVKDPENADCIFKEDLFTMLEELIDNQSHSMKKLLQWQDELQIMKRFIEMVSKSEDQWDESCADKEGIERCIEGYFKDIKVLISLQFDRTHDFIKNDKDEISTVVSRFLDHVNRLTQHNQPSELDLDFILLDENETIETMVTLAADSGHLANAVSAIVSLESKNVECFATLFKLAAFPRPVFYSVLNELSAVVSAERMKEITAIVFGSGKQVNYSQEITRQECVALLSPKEVDQRGIRRRLTQSISTESLNSKTQ